MQPNISIPTDENTRKWLRIDNMTYDEIVYNIEKDNIDF